MKTPDDHLEWIEYFDSAWGISDWLSNHATVYGRPGSNSGNAYVDYYDPEGSYPDIVVDFDHHDDIAACFFVDAEDLEQITRELSPAGRLANYVTTPESALLEQNEKFVEPNAALLVTQFSPFGRVFAETLGISNPEVNEDIENIVDDDDFLTFFAANMLHMNISHAKSAVTTEDFDPTDTYHGLLSGATTRSKSQCNPAALRSPDPHEHDFWHTFWEHYTTTP